MAIVAASPSANPKAVAMEPNVPLKRFAIVSDRPKFFAAPAAKASTCFDIVGNATSTTFCTSARSEPRLIHSLLNATISFTEKAAAIPSAALPASLLMPFSCVLNPLLLRFKSRNMLPTFVPVAIMSHLLYIQEGHRHKALLVLFYSDFKFFSAVSCLALDKYTFALCVTGVLYLLFVPAKRTFYFFNFNRLQPFL